MTDPQNDEHIEELLGKLQGIFGKLSHSEEEEAKQKIEIPSPAPQEPAPKTTSVPPPEEAPPPKPSAPQPLNLYSDPASNPAEPPEAPVPDAYPIETIPAAAPPPAAAPSGDNGGYESAVPVEDAEKIIVPAAVYFPPGREGEAKSLAQKLETMAPKFTKVAFRLRVCVFMPYDPKSEWKETIITKAGETRFQAVFVVMDRPLEDGKRKATASALESRNIYFQEVTLASIEKKAFYTDILLGLVFFFDSRAPKSDTEGSGS